MGIDFDGDTYDNYPKHIVSLDSFNIGKYEVTNKEFCSFLNSEGNKKDNDGKLWYFWDNNKYDFKEKDIYLYERKGEFYVKKGYDNYPIRFISWNAAEAYCIWLSQKTNRKFRLPTEAEWEYVARSGGGNYSYSWVESKNTDSTFCNYGDASYYKTLSKKRKLYYPKTSYNDGFKELSPVGAYIPNGLGVYDMSGNVSEFCLDWYMSRYYSISPNNNPCCLDTNLITSSEIGKVVRGGNFKVPLHWCSNFNRGGRGVFISGKGNYVGFRIVEVFE